MSINSVEKLILGTVQLGLEYGINNRGGKPPPDECMAILDSAYKAGIRYLDTAEGYGNSQEIIGLYHEMHPKSLFKVITKLSARNLELQGSVARVIKADLQILKLTRLEGYMFHSFEDYTKNSDIIYDLLELKQKGLIAKLGVSIYTNEQAIAVLENNVIDFIQIPYNLLDNFSKRGYILQKAKEKNIEVHVRSVFLQGLFHMERALGKLEILSPYIKSLNQLAADNNVTLPKLALSYALSNPYISKVLIGVESRTQLHKNIDDLLDSKLSEKIEQQVNSINVTETDLLNPVNWV